jgi:hypothetical protein
MPLKYRLNTVILLPTKAYAAYATIVSLIELEPQQFLAAKYHSLTLEENLGGGKRAAYLPELYFGSSAG